jgi:hypothetical protein
MHAQPTVLEHTVPKDADRRVRCRVAGTEPIGAIDLVRNGHLADA